MERDAHRVLDVAGDPQVRGQEVRGAGGDDPDPHLGTPAERVDAALHHPVATPHDDEVGAGLERARERASAPSCSSAPRTRSGRRRLHAARARRELLKSASERLPRVRDHRHRGHDFASSRRRPWATALNTRATSNPTQRHPTPINAPLMTSIGWCMPRYIRASATATGAITAITTAAHACSTVLHVREHQHRDANVDDDAGGGVPRWVAGTGAEVLEPHDVRSRAVDDQRGREVGRGFDRDRRRRRRRSRRTAGGGRGSGRPPRRSRGRCPSPRGAIPPTTQSVPSGVRFSANQSMTSLSQFSDRAGEHDLDEQDPGRDRGQRRAPRSRWPARSHRQAAGCKAANRSARRSAMLSGGARNNGASLRPPPPHPWSRTDADARPRATGRTGLPPPPGGRRAPRRS